MAENKKRVKISGKYGHIPHLSTSKLGPGEHKITPGQERILTIKKRDKHDNVYIQEKLDGSCCGVMNVDGKIIAIQRHGFPCESSPHEQHRYFARWVKFREKDFLSALRPGERMYGEWLMQAHGTLYMFTDYNDLFVAFDIYDTEGKRLVSRGFIERLRNEETDNSGYPVYKNGITLNHPMIIWPNSISVSEALRLMGNYGNHGALCPAEGLIYRVERKGQVEFLAKHVRAEKEPGKYLFETGPDGTQDQDRRRPPTWNVCPALLNAWLKARGA